MALPARKLRRDEREERVELVSLWGAEQALLVERNQDFAAYVETFAPGLSRNVNAYAGRFRVEVERLWREIDEHEFIQRRALDLRRCLAAAWIAGTLGEAEPIDAKTDVVAVHIAYRRDERVRFVSLDLDGKDTDREILAAIRADIGDDSMLVHSGSGRERRCRLLLRLDKSKTIGDLQMLAKRWIAGLGFSVAQGDLEVFPGTQDGRCPFQLGGCTWFAPDLSTRKNQRPIDLWQRFVALKPIDIRALALRFPVLELEHESTKNAAKHGVNNVSRLPNTTEGLPRRYVAERRPPTPKAIRELAKQGISGVGERDDALYKLTYDRLCRSFSQEETVEYLVAMVVEGKFDKSRALQKTGGMARLIRDIERRVARVYATHTSPGMPLPVDLTASEVASVREIARIASMAYGFSENALRAFLMAILPIFKGVHLAGLAYARLHSWEWRKAGGSRFAELREACGIFAQVSRSYRAAKSLALRGLNDRAALEHAYAKSWKTSFRFDL